MNLKVGQKVYVKRIGNAARGPRGSYYTEETIRTVGRKWFTLESWPSDRFSIEDMIEDSHGYSATLCVYLTEQEILDDQEYSTLKAEITEYFSWMKQHKPTLDQLRRISQIIKEPT